MRAEGRTSGKSNLHTLLGPLLQGTGHDPQIAVSQLQVERIQVVIQLSDLFLPQHLLSGESQDISIHIKWLADPAEISVAITLDNEP